jgi:hypothetical protein
MRGFYRKRGALGLREKMTLLRVLRCLILSDVCS